jgi:hypothetical protein
MRVAANASKAADLKFRFPEGPKLPPEQVALLAGRFRITRDEMMAKEWGVTPQQLEKLNAMNVAGGDLSPAPADRDALWGLWQAYQTGSGTAKADAQKKLTEKLDEVAKANFEPSQKAFGAKIDEIRKVLTPEQVEKITKR